MKIQDVKVVYICPDHNEKYKKIGHYVSIFQSYLLKIINTNKLSQDKNDELVSQMKIACDKIISLSNKIVISDLEAITDKIYNKIEDSTIFFSLSIQILKKALKADYIKNIEKKLDSDEFFENLNNLEAYLFF